jgi:hypothetical protein
MMVEQVTEHIARGTETDRGTGSLNSLHQKQRLQALMHQHY